MLPSLKCVAGARTGRLYGERATVML